MPVKIDNFVFILAKDTFRAVGQKLQARRIHDDADVMLSYIPSEHQDPANDDPELRRQLDESSKNAEIKMKKVLDLLFKIVTIIILSFNIK